MIAESILQWTLLGARIGVAAVFAVAAVAKLADTTTTRGSLRAFGTPAWLTRPAAVGLPLAELAVAVLLAPAATARAGAALAVGLLVVFSAALARAAARGAVVDCNCFGALSSPRPWQALTRNALLAAAMAATAAVGPGRAVDVLVVVAAVVTAALAWVGWQLLRQPDRLVERPRTREDAGGDGEAGAFWTAPNLGPGDPAPRFALPDALGAWHTLDDLLVSGRPLMLAFSDPDCAACEPLPKRLAAWRDARADELEFALVTRGTPDSGAFPPALIQAEHEVARAYGAGHVPSALLIAPDGRVASPLAVGELAIERLLTAETEKAVR